MSRPYALLRSGYPYYMTLGQRRVTSNPVDIGFGEENVYVLTRGGLGTEVRVINWEDENLGLRGTGNFTWPTALLVDDDENLYVSDEAKHNVTIMDKDGMVLDTWGEHGSGEGQLDRPSSMQFDSEGNIVVSDTMNHRIQRFTRDGTHLQTIDNGQGSGEGELNMPWGVALDENGDVYVADWRNDRVQKFTADGEFVMSIGSKGDEKGQFNRPASVAVDAHGDIYVADWLNDRVQMFNAEGRFIEQFIGDANLSRSGRQYILANAVTLRLREMADLEPVRRLSAPCCVRVDSDFRLFICDFGQHRIQIYKKEAYELSEDQIAPPMRNPILFTT